MSHRQFKTGYFVLEGLNSFATTFFFYYLYFFMQSRFGFGNEANLALAALNGVVYALGSWWGGRFAQRAGYFTALKLGFGLMLLALTVGSQFESVAGQVAVVVAAVAGMSCTWPALEALVSEGETLSGIQHHVGVYNIVWAATGAAAYFTGGAMLEKLGVKSLFLFPAALLCVQMAATLWLEQRVKALPPPAFAAAGVEQPPRANGCSTVRGQAFLRMAWAANPFAYVAINTLVAAMPGVAKRLELSPMLAGFCCSLWCFVRVGAFGALWFWPGWHYRFRWLVASFVTLIGAFALILLAPNLAVLMVAQLFFGVAIGLIYYSSLFYSMDVGQTKGEHGGLHEAAIGVGNFAGPAVGAASLHFLPQYPSSGALAVCVLLVCGLGGLLVIWRMTKT